jgi:hypothetical protein
MCVETGNWQTPVWFQQFISADPAADTSTVQFGVTFTASKNGDLLTGGGINKQFGISASKRRAWAWSPDGRFFAYVSSANGPDWNLTIVALQEIRRSDCSIVSKGNVAATASGIFASGQSPLQDWNNSNFGWAGSKAVSISGAYAGGSGILRSLACPEAPTSSNFWSELIPDRAGQIDWVYLISPCGLAVAFTPKKLNASAPPLDFLLVSTTSAQQTHFRKNNTTQSIATTGINPSITTNSHANNGVRIDTGNGTTIDVDDPDSILRAGLCKVLPFVFPEVILNGPENRTPELQSSIMNTRHPDASQDGCLQIDGITNNNPFTRSIPSQFPVFIAPGMTSPLKISFSPLTPGSYNNKELLIALTEADPLSDTKVLCSGSARLSRAACSITGPTPVPEVIFGVNVNNSARCSFAITNSGDDKLRVDAITNNTPFSVVGPLPGAAHLLGHNDQVTVNVEYTPTAVGTIFKDLTVTCTPANGDSKMHCTGIARLPRLGITANTPAPFTAYCFRRKRVAIDVQNTGEVPLTMSVTGSPSSFSWVQTGPIPANTSQTLEVDVWSGALGPFSLSLTISGTFHVLVKDALGNTTIDNVLQTSCTVSINGTAIPMPPDVLEPNDDFVTATKVDLPMPGLLNPVQKEFVGLSLNDCAGLDKDFFAVSFQSSTQDDNCSGGGATTNLSLGMVMQIYPPKVAISSDTNPEKRTDGQPFTRALQIYKSDTHNHSLVTTTSGNATIECPSPIFPDKKLYAVLSNPDHADQGPVEYNIRFQYMPLRAILRCKGGVTKIEYIKLKKYYDAIWRVDPPRDLVGNPIDVKAWTRGAPVAINNLRSFIKKHMAYISLAEGKTPSRKANAVLASECFNLAQTASAGGLPSEAERLYQKSANYADKGSREVAQKTEALRGLLELYVANHLLAKAAVAAQKLQALQGKTRRIK